MNNTGRTMITAHSGCDDTGPNSLESIRRALEVKTGALEVDVRVDRRGEFTLAHDGDPAGEYPGAVRFAQALPLLAGQPMKVNCDLKEPGLEAAVIAFLLRGGLEEGQIILTGVVSTDVLRAHPEICRQAEAYLNLDCILPGFQPESERISDRVGEALCEALGYTGAAGLNLNHAHLTEEDVRFFHNQGVALSVWTLDEEAVLRRYLEWQVCNITTRRAALAMRLAQELLPQQ